MQWGLPRVELRTAAVHRAVPNNTVKCTKILVCSDVSLTVHLGITLDNNQLDAQTF
jgi:hypothetical protein